MILQVPFDQFAATIVRTLKIREAFVTTRGAELLLTAGEPGKQLIVSSRTTGQMSELKTKLEQAGLEVFEGEWRENGENGTRDELAIPHVAAVAYVSHEQTPGLWVDAYAGLPTHVTVLRALYQEFRDTGQVAEVTFEEFIRLAQPNVVIATPAELDAYRAAKEC